MHHFVNLQRQKGMTALGWIAVLAIIGIFTLAVLRIGPMYFEYYKITSVLSALNSEFGGKEASKQDIYAYISKRFDIEAITVIDSKEVSILRKDENMEIRAKYDQRSPFLGNLDFIASFDKAVEVPR